MDKKQAYVQQMIIQFQVTFIQLDNFLTLVNVANAQDAYIQFSLQFFKLLF